MTRLNPQKLHITFTGQAAVSGPRLPRVYTLTHSDRTGDLFLTIGSAVDHAALRDWQTRLMRDEVIAEWSTVDDTPELHVFCHVSGGLLNFGPAGWRYNIFRHHMPQVLQAFRYGDRHLYAQHPELDEAPIKIHFRARQKRFNTIEAWGTPANYEV